MQLVKRAGRKEENGEIYGTKEYGFDHSLAGTHTDFKLIFCLIGLVVVLTLGLYHAFNTVLRLVETRRRNGERLMDLMRSRLEDEQTKKYQRNQGLLG